jgi:glycosyltransferase involved in cell wall biosynthesis
MATWVEALLERGHQVELFTLAPELDSPTTFHGPNLVVHAGPYRRKGRARDMFSVERNFLLEAMKKSSCDVIHAHWTQEFALSALASGRPSLVTIHDLPFVVLRYYPSAYRVVRTMMAWKVARRATRMTAVSEDAALHFRRYFGFKKSLVTVPNMVSRRVFELGNERFITKRYAVNFASVSGWGALKNTMGALRAFAIVRGQIPEAHLVLFGPGHEEGGPAHIWAQRNGLAKGIAFEGMLPYFDLLRRLSTEIDVLLHASFVEAHCMAVAEALALGIPVIAGTNTGGMRFLLENGKCGMLTDVSSHDAIAVAMLHLASDLDLRNQLGAAGRASARARLTEEAVMTQYEREYESAIDEKV